LVHSRKPPEPVHADPMEARVHQLLSVVGRHGFEGAKAVEELAVLGGRAVPQILRALPSLTSKEQKMTKADLVWALTLIGLRSPQDGSLRATIMGGIREHGMTDGEVGVNEFSLWAVKRLDDQPPTIERAWDAIRAAPPQLRRGRECVPLILAALDLDVIGTEETIPALAHLADFTGRGGEYVRGTVAWALRKFKGNNDAGDLLFHLTKDPDEGVREIAGKAYEEWGGG
jgi:hypothetical protein